MDLLKVLLSAVLSVVVLFLLTKLMGKRQMSQLSMFDYIIGITIGSIAAEMATSLEGDIFEPLIAMTVYAIAAVAISFITSKSLTVRRFVTGKATVLIFNGKFYTDNMKKAKVDLNELLCMCRGNGYFDITRIKLALMEENGKISFLPLREERPLTPSDMNLPVTDNQPMVDVIIDGRILAENLKYTGNDEKWLLAQLKQQGFSDIKKVFLACCDANNELSCYGYYDKPAPRDIYS